MDDVQKKIDTLNQLFSAAQWDAASSDQADLLIEDLEQLLGENDQRVSDLGARLQRRNRELQAGAPSAIYSEVSAEESRAAAEESTTESRAAIDGKAIEEPGAFGEAVQALIGGGQFVLYSKLQTGQYSTGYDAGERAGGRRVVVKLPAQDAWEGRFDECAQAIVEEDNLLTAITPALAGSVGELCAQPIISIASGNISIPSWPKQIPWVAQTFAHGQRVRDLIPLRDAREPEGLRILVQVTGMARELYAKDFAHRDLKQDCLFWDSDAKRVEVIDWNRATRSPTAIDKELEFAALMRLTSAVLLGPLFRWSAADSYHRDLLLAFRGTPISRGSRLLLFRLLDPAHPRQIRDVDELYAALREVLTWWDQPLLEHPNYTELSPQALSNTLSRLSIETQRPNAESPIAAYSIDWQIEAFRAAQTDIQKRIRIWLADRKALRTAMRRVEEVWPWFPDIWPINLLVPLSRVFFKHLQRERDDLLATLAESMVANQWDEIVKRVRQFVTALPAQLPPQLLSLLQEIHKTALAYQTLDQTEQQLRSAPDYAAALSTTTQLREALSLDPRVVRLARQVDAGTEQAARSAQLLAEVEQLRSQELGSQGQRRLLQLLDDLRVLGVNDVRYNEQRQKVALIDGAGQAIDLARGAVERGENDQALRALEPWRNRAELSAAAPDLARCIELLTLESESRAAQKQIDTIFLHVRQFLTEGNLGAAIDLARQAQSLAEHIPSRLSEWSRGEIDRLNRGLSKIAGLWQALEQPGNHEIVERLNTTDLPIVTLQLVRALNELVDRRSVLNSIADLDTALNAYVEIMAPFPDLDTFAGLAPLYVRLQTAALVRLEQALRTMLEQNEELSEQQLQQSKSALQQLRSGFGERAGLDSLEHLIELRSAEQFHTIAAQINTSINEIKEIVTPFSAEIRRIRETVAPLSGVANHSGLATKADVTSIAASLNAILKDLQTLSARPLEQTARTNALSNVPVTVAPRMPAIKSPDAAPGMITNGEQSSSDHEMAGQVVPIWRDSRMRPWLALAALAVVVLIGGGFFLARGRPHTGVSGTQSTATTSAIDSTSDPIAGTIATSSPDSLATIAPPATQPTALPTIPPAQPIDVVAPTSAILSSTIALHAPGIDAVQQLKAEVLSTTVILTPTNVTRESIQLFLPENLLARTTNAFSMPITLSLLLGDGFMPASVSISETVVTVRGVNVADSQEVYSGGAVKGAYLWKNQQGRDPATDTVKPTGEENNPTLYILLEDGDQVRILGGAGDFYYVRVESNQADGKNAIGRPGWVRKALIHGR